MFQWGLFSRLVSICYRQVICMHVGYMLRFSRSQPWNGSVYVRRWQRGRIVSCYQSKYFDELAKPDDKDYLHAHVHKVTWIFISMIFYVRLKQYHIFSHGLLCVCVTGSGLVHYIYSAFGFAIEDAESGRLTGEALRHIRVYFIYDKSRKRHQTSTNITFSLSVE